MSTPHSRLRNNILRKFTRRQCSQLCRPTTARSQYFRTLSKLYKNLNLIRINQLDLLKNTEHVRISLVTYCVDLSIKKVYLISGYITDPYVDRGIGLRVRPTTCQLAQTYIYNQYKF